MCQRFSHNVDITAQVCTNNQIPFLYNLTHAHTHTCVLRAGTISITSQEPFKLQGQQTLYTRGRVGNQELDGFSQTPAARQGTTNITWLLDARNMPSNQVRVDEIEKVASHPTSPA